MVFLDADYAKAAEGKEYRISNIEQGISNNEVGMLLRAEAAMAISE